MYVNYSTSSGVKTDSAQISTMPGSLSGIDVMNPTQGVNLITLYDSADSNTAGKTVVAIIEADAGMVGIHHEFFSPVAVNQGIYAAVTGTGVGVSYLVRYAL